MNEEEFRSVLSSIDACYNLHVRFGFEIFIPALEKAMQSISDPARLRVHVDFPFEGLRQTQEALRDYIKLGWETKEKVSRIMGKLMHLWLKSAYARAGGVWRL